MRSKGVIFALAKIVDIPLHIDEATADLLRPSEARVCVEVNLEHKLPERIWIDRGDGRSFWQTVVYEKPPLFCSKCRHMGHSLGPAKLWVKKLLLISLSNRPQYDREHSVDETQQTVDPDSRHVGLTIDFLHSTCPSDLAIHSTGHSTALILPTSVFAYDYSLHDRLLTTTGHTNSLPFTVGPITESRSIIDHVYGSSLHDRPAISVGPTSTLAHSEFFDHLLDVMLAAPRAGACLDNPVDFTHVEAFIPSISSAVLSDASSPVQMGTHQQGHFRRSSHGDLTGLDKYGRWFFFSLEWSPTESYCSSSF
ncbi:Uncharacterized protein Adt_21185 [Abeliophyllum distichum]|uniref:Uncharacterized protein n=1 Tax=Abeliophyllum distichum TaxID=126358 RepID=A0ABD1SYP8_9LAMI